MYLNNVLGSKDAFVIDFYSVLDCLLCKVLAPCFIAEILSLDISKAYAVENLAGYWIIILFFMNSPLLLCHVFFYLISAAVSFCFICL